METTHWKNEFGAEYAVPGWVSGPSVIDTSWHNDACPSFVPAIVDEDSEMTPVLWVEHATPGLRETQGSKRFCVWVGRRGFGDAVWQFDTDDEAEARRVWTLVLASSGREGCRLTEVPAGECPKCGALCQPWESPLMLMQASTSNLPEKLARRMDDGGNVGVIYDRVSYGWLVRHWPSRPEEWRAVPIPMKRVIEAAEAKGCTMILFDCDATPVAGLPTWDW